MLRHLATALVAAIVGSAARDARRELAVGGTCAPRDERSERLVANFKAFVGKADMAGTIERRTLRVQSVAPAQVSLVTEKGICTMAAEAFDKKLTPELKRATYVLYVITLGSSYGVEDTKILQDGFETAFVFDSNWRYVGVRQIH